MFWRNGMEAAEVAVATRALAECGAGLAGQTGTECVVARLAESVESEVGVGGTPDADDGDAECGGEVHVGGVHGDHEGEVAYDVKFFAEGVLPSDVNDVWMLSCELLELGCFIATAEEDDMVSVIGEHECKATSVFPWPYFARVLSEGSEADC